MSPAAPSAAPLAAPPPTLPRPASAGVLALVSGDRLVTASRPNPEAADSYLRVAARILLEGERTPGRTIGVISALRGEGKTTAALNLGICLGRARGKTGRVLLVDGDVRQRTLSRLLSCSAARPGEGVVLAATGFEGLDLLTAPPLADPLTLVSPHAWTRTLRDLSARYAFVVIDCPAVLADPGGVVLRECVDHLVVVVRSGVTPQASVRRAIGDAGRRVVGVLMNGASAASARPGGGL